MAKMNWGILDGFFGKVGTVVGSFWKSIPVMRAYKRVVRNPKTESQQLVRTRFAAINSLSGAFHSALQLGLAEVARRCKQTEGDVFVARNWECVHADTPGAATVDYTELVIADGKLPEVLFGNASFAEPLQVSVPMTDTTGVIDADSHDKVYLFVYSPEAGAGVMSSGASPSAPVPTTKASSPTPATSAAAPSPKTAKGRAMRRAPWLFKEVKEVKEV